MDKFMQYAINQAIKSGHEGGIPIGSVLIHKDRILGQGHNQRIQQNSMIHHAEMNALENAGRQAAATYKECILYTTLSPCSMCSGAILLYQIPKVIIGENKTLAGAEELLRSQGVALTVLQDPQCIELMSTFIATHPGLWHENIGEDD
ncbi:MAG: nucleoside deaminase [Gammaproteobacteria bacterium]